MKKLLSCLIIFFVIALAASSDAAVNSYTFSPSNTVYTPLSGGTSYGYEATDDTTFPGVNIGFPFFFNGSYHSQVNINSNGFVFFGTATAVFGNFFPLSTGADSNVVVASGQDLQAQVTAGISSQTAGTPGSQVFTVQWTNYRHYLNVTGDTCNFQIKLYEGTGKIEIVYGHFNWSATSQYPQVGLRGATNADFINRTTNSDWTATTAGLLNTDGDTLTSAIVPPSGLTFTWLPPAVDLSVSGLINPAIPGCYTNNQTVTVRVKNITMTTHSFVSNPLTIYCAVSGTNPTTFTPLTISTGSLGSLMTEDQVITTSYDMSAVGLYNFTAYLSTSGDLSWSNDTMPTVVANGTQTVGTSSISTDTTCNGTPVLLTLSGSVGSVQWQSSTGGPWTNETGTGNTDTLYSVTPSTNKFYRAQVCGTLTSNEDTLTVITISPPVGTPATRCGLGSITLDASGTGTKYWYNVPTGGTALDTGNTFTTNVVNTTTFYVSEVGGGGVYHVGKTSYTSGLTNTAGAYLIFDAMSEFTLNSVVVYPYAGTSGTAGVVTIALQNSAGVNLQTYNANLTGDPSPIPAIVPVHFIVQPGTGYRLTFYSSTGIFDLFRDPSGTTGIAFPYTIPGVVSIIDGSLAGYYYYFYDWNISTGCESVRVPVIATVTPATPITETPLSATLCSGHPTTINAGSSNGGYTYSWSPTTGLSAATGASVTATPSMTTTYSLDAVDGSGCHAVNSTTITVNHSPSINATATPPLVCQGNSSTLNASNNDPAMITIGSGTIGNTSTTYPTPYGTHYFGAKNQMLILASELNAAGFFIGSFNSVAWDVTALNACGTLANFTVSMGSTSLSSLTTFQTGLTQVFTVPSYQPVLGWNTHSLSTPFHWDGVSNIIIETCFDNTAFVASTNAVVNQSTTTFNSSIYYNADAATVCTSTIVNGITAQRPNVQLGLLYNYGYTWTPSANLNSATVASPVASPSVTTPYTLTVVNQDNACTLTDTTNVAVGGIAVGTPGAISGMTTLCQGAANVTFLVGTIANATSYIWSLPAGFSVAAQTDSILSINVSSTASSGNITVHGSNPCGAGPLSPSLHINILASPVVNITSASGTFNVCYGDSIRLSILPSCVGCTYAWSPGSSINPATVSNPYAKPTITTPYTVTVTNSLLCSTTSTQTVTVLTLPAFPILTQSNDTLFSTTALSYQWNRNGVPVGGATSQFMKILLNGSYSVTITDANGCKSTSAPVDITNVGIIEFGRNNTFSLYPNPFNESTTLSYNLPQSQHVKVELYNILGEKVAVLADESQSKGNHQIIIDGKALHETNGMVFLKITTDNETISRRLIQIK